MGERTVFTPKSTVKTMSAPWTDPDGKMWIDVIPHTALVAKTPYKVVWNEYGWVTEALSASSGWCYIGVPDTTGVSGTKMPVQIGGLCEDMITPSITSVVGYGVKLSRSLVAISPGDFSGATNEFGSCQEASSGTTHDVLLYGRPIQSRIEIKGTEVTAQGGIIGCGTGGESATTSDTITTATADTRFLNFWLEGSAASGTYRGMYMKLYLTGGAGGEAIRAYTTVIAAAPVDTVNAIHASLGFGTSVGNITGLGTAIRATVMVPARSLTGTVAGVMAEFNATATTSDCVSATDMALFKGVLSGDATGIHLLDTSAYFISFSGGATDDAHMFRTNTASPTHGLRCLINGVRYDICMVATHS